MPHSPSSHFQKLSHKKYHFLESILENIPHMIFIKEVKELRFVHCNKAALDILGYTKKELIGKNTYELFSSEEADRFNAQDNEAIQQRKILDIPHESVVTNYGKTLVLHTKKIPICNDHGEPEFLLCISQDITKQYTLEQELLSQQEKTALILDVAKVGIWDLSIKDGEIKRSLQHDQIYGYDNLQKEWNVDCAMQHILPSYQKLFTDTLKKSMKSGLFALQFQIRRADGAIRWIDVNAKVFYDQKHQPSHMLGIIIDSTERQDRQELERNKQELEQFKQAVECSTDAIIFTDANGIILYTNPSWQKLTGYTADEIRGKTLNILHTGKTPPIVYPKLWDTITHKNPFFTDEIVNKRKDGSEFRAELHIYPILSPGKDIRFFVGVENDITQKKEEEHRKKEEKKLLKDMNESLQQFRESVDAATDAISIVLPDFTYHYVNPAWIELTGYSAQDVIGKKIGWSYKNRYHLLLERMKTMKKSRQKKAVFQSDDLIFRRKNGIEYNAEVTLYPVYHKEKIAFFVLIRRDITLRKRSDLAKSEFMAIASHQLRTPLTAIRWSLSSLRRASLKPSQKKIVVSAYEAAVNMSTTIQTMLTISQLESGEITPVFSIISLPKLIKKIVSLHIPHQKRNKLTMAIQCPNNLSLRTDEHLLSEILHNLLSNANKYTPRRGAVKLSVTQKAGNTLLSITDTGYGIPQSEQARISEKFFRASNVAGKEESGTGIGLHMTYNITRLIGGSISFVSQENKGTTFTVTLPSLSS